MTTTKAPPKAWRSGWCGSGNPPTSHQRCAVFAPGTGTPCVCDCHTTSGPDDMPAAEVVDHEYDALVARVARRYASHIFRSRNWDDLEQRSRDYSTASARQAVDLVTTELKTWEP